MFGTRKKEANFKFDLGDKVKDSITGFEGIIICRTQWLHNCNVYNIKPTTLKESGEPKDSVGFDEPQLKLVEPEVVKKPKKITGGPTSPVSRTNR